MRGVRWQALAADNATHSALLFVDGSDLAPPVLVDDADVTARCDLGADEAMCALTRDDERLAARHRVRVRVGDSVAYEADGFVPAYCAVDEAAPIDSALCLTQATWTDAVGALRYAVSGSFTVAFWVKSAVEASRAYGNVFAPVGVPFAARIAVGADVALVDEFDSAGRRGHEGTLRARVSLSFDGRWRHIVVVFDASAQRMELFVDGSDASVMYAGSFVGNFSLVPVIGYARLGNQPFPPRALVGDVRVSNRALTLAEIDNAATQWTHRWVMQTCAGERLDADPSPLFASSVHNAYFVCKDSVKPPLERAHLHSTLNGDVALRVTLSETVANDWDAVTAVAGEQRCRATKVGDGKFSCSGIAHAVYEQASMPLWIIVRGVWSRKVALEGMTVDHCTIGLHDAVDHALCLTDLTTTVWGKNRVPVLSDDFTVSFFSKGFPRRQRNAGGIPPLFTYLPNTHGALGFFLDQREFLLGRRRRDRASFNATASIREFALLGDWHRFVLTNRRGNVSVWLDSGQTSRHYWSFGQWSTSFSPLLGTPSPDANLAGRALIADLRIANESMSAAQARERSLPNSTYDWTFHYPMRTCAGDRLTADPDPLFGAVRRARFICKESVKPRVERAWFHSTKDGLVGLGVYKLTIESVIVNVTRRNVSAVFGDDVHRCQLDIVLDNYPLYAFCASILPSVYEHANVTMHVLVDGVWSNEIGVSGMSTDHCRLDDDDPVDSALCTTAVTTTVLPKPFVFPGALSLPFTVSFWAKSADLLRRRDNSLMAYFTTTKYALGLYITRNQVHIARTDSLATYNGTASKNVRPATDFFASWRNFVLSSQQNIVMVWIDGTLEYNKTGPPVVFGIRFGTDSRVHNLAAQALIADIRIANESMTAAEARERSLPNSTYAWSKRYPMRACSGRDLAADPDPLFRHVRRALFVCKPAVMKTAQVSTTASASVSGSTKPSSIDISRRATSSAESPLDGAQEQSMSQAIVVGAACAASLVVVLAVVAALFVWRRHNRRQECDGNDGTASDAVRLSALATTTDGFDNDGDHVLADNEAPLPIMNDQYVEIPAARKRATQAAPPSGSKQYSQRPQGYSGSTEHYVAVADL